MSTRSRPPGNRRIICPLSPAHIAGFTAFLLYAILLFVDVRTAPLPLLAFLLACVVAPFLPRLGFFLPIVGRGKPGEKGVALTFDDGPDPEVTPLLLDLLDRHSVPATFFVTGERAAPSSLHHPGHPVPRSRDRQPLLPPPPVPDAERDPDAPAGDRIDPVPARRVRHRPPGVPASRRDHESPPPAGPPRAGNVLRQLQLPRRRHREPADRAPLRKGAEGGLPGRHRRAPRRRAAERRDGASHGRVRRPAPRIEGEGSRRSFPSTA